MIFRQTASLVFLTSLVFSGGTAAVAEKRPYTEPELEMLRLTNESADARVGWREGESLEVTANDIRRAGNNFDWWNPLWDDRNYARDTRYGDIIAPPFFLQNLAGAGLDMTVVPGVGSWRGGNDGATWEWFHPLRPGDFVRVWQERPVITDITEGGGPRTFHIDTTWRFVNQNDATIASFTSFLTNSFSQDAGPGQGPQHQAVPPPGAPGSGPPPPGPPPGGAPPGFGGRERARYTADDWAFINSIADGEVIRGSDLRYWEDVDVGDVPAAVIAEPTTVIDMIKIGGDIAMSIPPIREIPKELGKELSQDEYGVYHLLVEGHFTPLNSSNSMHFMAFGESVMGRLVTNWMGDDGWITKFDAGHRDLAARIRSSSVLSGREFLGGHGVGGDAVVGRAEVVAKYIAEGNHLVDVVVWTENLAGQVWQTATVTVALVTKRDGIKE